MRYFEKRVSISHNRKNLAVVYTKFILEIDSHKTLKQEKNSSKALSQVYKSISYSFISASIYLK